MVLLVYDCITLSTILIIIIVMIILKDLCTAESFIFEHVHTFVQCYKQKALYMFLVVHYVYMHCLAQYFFLWLIMKFCFPFMRTTVYNGYLNIECTCCLSVHVITYGSLFLAQIQEKVMYLIIIYTIIIIICNNCKDPLLHDIN